MIMSPMRLSSVFLPALAVTLLSGCTVGKIVTAPIRVAGTAVETAVDATTQTQSEKEQDLGRRVLAERKRELNACLDRAETKAERKHCKKAYEDDGY